VDVIVNGEPAGSHTFTPASWTRADPVRLRVPAREGPSEVRLVKKGPGTLYWTATARYYDTAGAVEATGTRKLALSREYFSLAPVTVKDRIVYRATPFEGAARPGDLILVRLVAAGAREWKHLVVEDPMPAGCEAVTRPEAYDLEHPPAWWWGSQREYRDDRVVTFLERFVRGRYELSYLLRVVTPGEFRAMPAQITPMYAPGVSATTGIETLRVSPPGPAPAATGGGGTR